MDKKELINMLILDLAQDAPMSHVMLMAQAVSFELQNKLFSDWIRKEQRGYEKCKDKWIPRFASRGSFPKRARVLLCSD